MTVADDTITIDANVFNYITAYTESGNLPNGLVVRFIEEFISLYNTQKVAVNDWIRTEFMNCTSKHTVMHWLKNRGVLSKLKEIAPVPLPNNLKKYLFTEFGFNSTLDMKYLETANQTFLKVLITYNDADFKKKHKSKRKQTLDKFIEREIKLKVRNMDEYYIEFSPIITTLKETASSSSN